ncbi:MAG: hypothetical protein R3F54_23325 [Alphaproteobacteria bacterium]
MARHSSDRLGHAEEHQPDANADGEQHGNQSRQGKYELASAAEPDRAEGRDDQEKTKQYEDIEPAIASS